ncbi:hypothetical protein [Pseudorhodoferax sp.]|uniref:hypothetical protein n=1 Tax=Pseudorhodoferax sp. TaxID=1993553 RepID=UPI0039E38B82
MNALWPIRPDCNDEQSDQDAAKKAANDQVAAYYTAMDRAANPAATSTDVAACLNEGIGLVDSHCRRWFQRLEDFERQARWRAKDVNVISQLGTALIGLARLNSDVTTAYGAGMATWSGLQDNRLDGLVIAPSTRGVKAKLFKVLEERAAVLREATPEDFVAARSHLEAYSDLCTFSTARDLVDKSVSSAEPKAESTGEIRITQVAGVSTVTGVAGSDQEQSILLKLWRPDGKAMDKTVDARLDAWLKKAAPQLDVADLLTMKGAAALRRRALAEVRFSN